MEKNRLKSYRKNIAMWTCILIVIYLSGCNGQSPDAGGSTSTIVFPVVSSSVAPLPNLCTTGENNCHDFANCVWLGTTFECRCNTGFQGNGRNPNGCTDINECDDITSCDGNAKCFNTPGSFTCQCKKGFTGDGKTCTNINECDQPNICVSPAVCVDKAGGFDCNCPDGYTKVGQRCKDVNECTANPSRCRPNGVCRNTLGSFACDCNAGYRKQGQFNCQDINECTMNTHNCDNNANCINTPGSFTCQCKDGFTKTGDVCTDINECLDTNTRRCHQNARCENAVGGYNCVCNKGYTGDGQNCRDQNECNIQILNTCISPAVCTNTIGSFVCDCGVGYKKVGNNECQDIDESKIVPSVCPEGSTTQNTIGSYICVCNAGYSGNPCTDINECATNNNNCDPNANCINTAGSFTCECKTGFTGNGFSCTDINECDSNNCAVSGAICVNTIGSFQCVCVPGYTGNGFSCTDKNECNDNLCDQDCRNTPGSYVCSCKTGYTFSAPHTCTDINECNTNAHNCHVNADCTNTDGSFTCKCKSGYLGNGVECVVDNFVPYRQCNFLQNVDVNQPIIRLQNKDGFPLAGNVMNDVYVCVNGFITLGIEQCDQGPAGELGENLHTGTIFAPFWADIDLRIPRGVTANETNRMYYCQYSPSDFNNGKATENTNIHASVQKVISTYTNVKNYVPSNTIIVAWNEVRPFPSSEALTYFNSNQKATFEVVLTSDGENTFVYYVYYNMNWNDPTFKVQVGYRYHSAMQSIKPQVFPGFSRLRFDKARFRGGDTGLFVDQVSDRSNQMAALDCNKWQKQQPTVAQIKSLSFQNRRLRRRRSCPCTIQQAVRDSQYKPEDVRLQALATCWYRNRNRNRNRRCSSRENRRPYCIQRKQVWLLNNIRNSDGDKAAYVTRCCYDLERGGLIKTVSGQPEPLTQTHFQFTKLSQNQLRRGRALFINTLINNNALPFTQCCRESAKCNVYESHSIVPDCSNYRPRRRSPGYGDPHFITLDGLEYTFNGLGDYVLITSDTSQIQSRTCKALNTVGAVNATVFCGFAISVSDEVKVEFYYDLKANTSTLIVNGTERNLVTASYDTVDIVYEVGATEGILEIQYLSGLSLEISIFRKMLQSSISVPDDLAGTLKGLLGDYNGDKDNDLVSRNGTVFSLNSSESEIYYNFGLGWAVQPSESMFSQPHIDLDSFFVPIFFTNLNDMFDNNVTAINEAIMSCGNVTTNRECFFDLAVSHDVTLAVNGKDYIQEETEVTALLQTEPPAIIGPTQINVTYLERINFTIMAVSNASKDLTYFINTNFSSSFTLLDNKTGVVEFVPTTRTETIEIGVVDEFGLSAILQVRILYCFCEHNGECDYRDLEIEGEYFAGVYVNFVQCLCPEGFTGSHCETEVDVCVDTPCFANVSCENTLNGTAKLAKCGSCPFGYTGDGRKCYDVDDCAVMQPCQQQCQNTIGSFACSCFSGYNTFNSTHCTDANECQNATACSGQNELCENTIGSFRCVCRSGYRRNSLNLCVDINECNETTDNCQQSCVNTPGSFTCGCKAGYTRSQDGRTCVDVNECESANDCSSQATCTNTPGSYLCFCNPGYTGTGKVCRDLDECDSVVRASLKLPLDCSTRCINTVGSYRCECDAGFQLSVDKHTCNEQLNPCLTGTSNCHENASCNYITRQVNCSCNTGYFGDGRTCTDVNECSPLRDCQQKCRNTLGSYVCECNEGYRLNADGKTCDDVEECVLRLASCPSNSRCVNTVGSYNCNCDNGFIKNGNSCDNRNECTIGNGGCNQTCTDTAGSFTCSCNSGYELNPDGKACEDVDECLLARDDCHAMADCQNTIGSYKCSCRNGYSGNGRTCTNINECIDNTHNCDTTAVCVDTEGSFTCSCKTGFALQPNGISCEDIDECLLGTANCAGNLTCLNTQGSFICKGTCELGNNCEQRCNNTMEGYFCYCSPGYQIKSDEQNKCVDVNECMDTLLNDCHTSADCMNSVGSYRCQCRTGFIGDGKTPCTRIGTTTTPSSRVHYLNGSIATVDPTLLDGKTLDFTDPTTISAFQDPTSQLYRDYSAAVQKALLIKLKGVNENFANVQITSLRPTATGVTVHYTAGSFVVINDTATTLQTRLVELFRVANYKLDGEKLNATVTQRSITINDFDECANNRDICHKDATCVNVQNSYNCVCKSGFQGDGFSCTRTAIKFIHQDGVIKLYDSVLDGIQINVNDANVVTALGNPSSTFHKKYKTAVEEGIYAVLSSTSNSIASVNVKTITPAQQSVSNNITVTYELVFYNNNSDTPSAVQTKLQNGFTARSDALTVIGFTARVIPTSHAITDQNECATGVHNCHTQATCTNADPGFTCACNTGYQGSGETCKKIGVDDGDNDNLTTLAAILATVGVGLLILIILLIWFVLNRRKRKSSKDSDTSSSYDGSASWTPFPFGQMRARSMYVPRGVVPTQYKDIPEDER